MNKSLHNNYILLLGGIIKQAVTDIDIPIKAETDCMSIKEERFIANTRRMRNDAYDFIFSDRLDDILKNTDLSSGSIRMIVRKESKYVKSLTN